jgi:hypothetical protein
MKFTFTFCFLVISLSPLTSLSQLNNGGLYANFGVDSDTRNNYMKYGLLTGQAEDGQYRSIQIVSLFMEGPVLYRQKIIL